MGSFDAGHRDLDFDEFALDTVDAGTKSLELAVSAGDQPSDYGEEPEQHCQVLIISAMSSTDMYTLPF